MRSSFFVSLAPGETVTVTANEALSELPVTLHLSMVLPTYTKDSRSSGKARVSLLRGRGRTRRQVIMVVDGLSPPSAARVRGIQCTVDPSDPLPPQFRNDGTVPVVLHGWQAMVLKTEVVKALIKSR